MAAAGSAGSPRAVAGRAESATAPAGYARPSLGRSLLAVGAAVLVLSAAGATQLGFLRNQLISARVAELREDVATARQDFDRIPRLSSQSPRRRLCAPAPGDAGDSPARELVRAVTSAGGRRAVAAVYDRSLRPLALPEPPAAGLPLTPPPRLPDHDLRDAVSGRAPAPEVVEVGAGGEQLALALPIELGAERPCGVLQVSVPLGSMEVVLAAERAFLLALGAALTAVALLFWWAGHRGRR